jgi:hypothetical protein
LVGGVFGVHLLKTALLGFAEEMLGFFQIKRHDLLAALGHDGLSGIGWFGKCGRPAAKDY